jgi:hypothetical protein
MRRQLVAAVVLWAGSAVACPRPATLPVEVPHAGCPTVRLGAEGWTVDTGASRAPRLVLRARRGHDRLTLVVALDRRPQIELTSAPG